MQATRLIGCLAVALLAVPIGARAADDEAARMKALEERMRVLEDKLASSNATIEAQQEMLQRSTPAVSQGAPAGVDAFFNKLEVGGFVTGSYLYNLNHPQDTVGNSAQPLNQFNRRNDEFSFDAAKLELGKTAAAPGEGGFQLDVLYGQNAEILRAASPNNPTLIGDSNQNVFVQQAYAAYNWSGVNFKLGQWVTPLGYEVLDSVKNPNVTHGLLYTWAIPLYHTGLLATGPIGEGFSWTLGLTNGFNNALDNNHGKGVVGQLSATSGPFSGSLGAYWGAERSPAKALPSGTDPGLTSGVPNTEPGSTDHMWIFDAIGTFKAADNLSFWANADYGWQEDASKRNLTTLALEGRDADAIWWGAAVGAKMKLTDKLGAAVRAEYFNDPDDVRRTSLFGPTAVPNPFETVKGSNVELVSLTGTLSYNWSPNLLMRGEVRYDKADSDVACQVGGVALSGGCGNIFPDDSDFAGAKNHDVFGLVELSYIFD